MAVNRLNPPQLAPPQGFVHVSIGTGNRIVFIAGQVASDQDGNLVGEGDLAAQTEQALLNVSAALEAAEASFDDVAKATIYVVDWHEDKLEQLIAGAGKVAERLGNTLVASSTLVPVPRLFEPGYLVEFDVTAVAD
jgi:enamine deaminase RidA (YjgF/YER057c/UK114 family)